MPVLANEVGAMDGFCNVELKPDGPVQLNVAPAVDDAPRFNEEPRHTLLPVMVGLTGG